MATAYEVHVSEDGLVDPPLLRVPAGSVVEWRIPRRQAILPVAPDDAGAPRRAPHVGDANDFTGPLVRAIPGIHAMNLPSSRGPVLPDWIWDEPGFTCVYFRLSWDEVNPAPGEYEWGQLSQWMNRAVESGKFFGVSVKAGVQATPQWLFNDSLGDRKCRPIDFSGIEPLLGLPWDPNYQHWYFGMLEELARHIRSYNGWWQRLASVRASGANYHSAEARLPNRPKGQPRMRPSEDDGGDIPPHSDAAHWAAHGYTPGKLYGFFGNQCEMLRDAFPGKDICYQLIQAGFPRANADDPDNRPGATEQTDKIIANGRNLLGNTWIVQHLLMRPRPDEDFPGEGWHPIKSLVPRGEYDWVKSHFPNNWALRAGLAGSPTAWQTGNALRPKDIDETIANAWFNSDGIWLEVYHDNLAPFHEAGSVPLGDSGLTIEGWSDLFYDWRMKRWGDEIGDPFPTTHRHTFADPGTYAYVLGTYAAKAYAIEVV